MVAKLKTMLYNAKKWFKKIITKDYWLIWYKKNKYVLPVHILFVLLVLMGNWFIPALYYLIVGIYLFLRKVRSWSLFNVIANNSVMICGAKGKGKDLLTQAYIIYNNKQEYYSNMNYGGCYNVLNYKDINLNGNTFENLIEGNVNKMDHYGIKEGADIIISDSGIAFPSQYDSLLKKKYPSLPIYVAISRHLSNTNILVNCQAHSRVWKLFREQFDNFILCKKTTSKRMQRLLKCLPILNKYLFIECYYYEQEEAFVNKLMPFDKSGLVSRNNAFYSTTADTLKKTYDFEHGKIIKYIVPVNKLKIVYNTRAFANYFFTDKLLKERGLCNYD